MAIPEDMLPLIDSHMALARSIAYRIYKPAAHALELEELQAVAVEGLCSAAQRWDAYCQRKGFNREDKQYFTAYAEPRIRGAVFDFVRAKDWATRSLRDKSKKLKLAGLDQGVSYEELSEKTGIPVEEINSIVSAISKAPISLESLNAKQFDDIEYSYGFQPADPEDVESAYSVEEILSGFVAAIEQLTKEQQVIVVLRYYRQLDLKEIARNLSVSESRISSLHTSAILSLLEVLKQSALGTIADSAE